MLSVAVHKDIAEYQPKIVGKMTMRTLVSITGALSVSVLAGLYIYFVLGLNVSDCTYFIYAVSLNEFASADHSSLAKMRGACHAALENVYGSEFTDALESGYDLNAESHDCASGSAVLETCDTTRAEQPMNHAKGVR